MSKRYNGHPSWALWNVSLWINNEEGLYNMARAWVRRCRTKEEAAKRILEEFETLGLARTPDGARYTMTSVRHALRGM